MNPETIDRLDGKSVIITQPNLPKPAHGTLKADHEHRRLELVVFSPIQSVYTHRIEDAFDIDQILTSEKEGQIRFNAPVGFLPETYFG